MLEANWKLGGGADLSKILPPKSEGQTILAYPQNPNLVGEEEGGEVSSPSQPPGSDHGSDACDQYV